MTAVFLSLGLALTACGSRVDSGAAGGSAPAAAEGTGGTTASTDVRAAMAI